MLMLHFLPALPKFGHMAAVLKTTCRSICRASIYSGRRWPFLLWYNLVLSQPRLLVSVSSTVQNKCKTHAVSARSLKIKEKKREKSKESVPKRLNRRFPSLYSDLFLPVHQPSSRRRPRNAENHYVPIWKQSGDWKQKLGRITSGNMRILGER